MITFYQEFSTVKVRSEVLYRPMNSSQFLLNYRFIAFAFLKPLKVEVVEIVEIVVS